MNTQDIQKRLEYLRGEIQAERISTIETLELQSLVEYIEPDDVELLQWVVTDDEADKIEYRNEQNDTREIEEI